MRPQNIQNQPTTHKKKSSHLKEELINKFKFKDQNNKIKTMKPKSKKPKKHSFECGRNFN